MATDLGKQIVSAVAESHMSNVAWTREMTKEPVDLGLVFCPQPELVALVSASRLLFFLFSPSSSS